MTKEAQKLLERALKLPRDERAKLAQLLNESLDEEPAPESKAVKKAWADEIKRRVREIDEGKVKGIPHEKVMQEFHKRFGKPKGRRSK